MGEGAGLRIHFGHSALLAASLKAEIEFGAYIGSQVKASLCENERSWLRHLGGGFELHLGDRS